MRHAHYVRSPFTILSYCLSSCLGLRVLGSKPNQSSRPGNSNKDRHHVILPAFAYKTATPREAASTPEYLRKKTSISQHARTSTRGNSSSSNQCKIDANTKMSRKQSTKSYDTWLTGITLLLLAPRSFFLQPRSRRRAPSFAPGLLPSTNDADVPTGPHHRGFLLLLPRVRRLARRPPSSERPQQSKQIFLPVRVPPRSCCFHLFIQSRPLQLPFLCS